MRPSVLLRTAANGSRLNQTASRRSRKGCEAYATDGKHGPAKQKRGAISARSRIAWQLGTGQRRSVRASWVAGDSHEDDKEGDDGISDGALLVCSMCASGGSVSGEHARRGRVLLRTFESSSAAFPRLGLLSHLHHRAVQYGFISGALGDGKRTGY